MIGVVFAASVSLAQSMGPATLLEPRRADPAFIPDVELTLTARVQKMEIFKGKKTTVWTYQGQLLKGEKRNLTESPDSYLGPTIRVRQGQKVRVHFKNELPEVSIIHWHGLILSQEMDGHPRYVIAPGKTYVYEFKVLNRAGTYWYHPHPDQLTGKQVYYGLAGLFIIEDQEEQSLALPAAEFDSALVIQDRSFEADGGLNYFPVSSGHMMGAMPGMDPRLHGFYGPTPLVNGKPAYSLEVKTAYYRLRILNGSNARVYKLALSQGLKFQVIATDGGLIAAPLEKEFLVLGPGERIEVLVDFSKQKPGSMVTLRSLPFKETSPMQGMGGMMRPARGASHDGEDLAIAAFKVSALFKDPFRLPGKLSSLAPANPKDALNAAGPRKFNFQSNMMGVNINGRTFEMNAVAADEVVKYGTSEIWELFNSGDDPMPHPVHIHSLQFRVIDRQGTRPDFKEGLVDQGWKDTVLLMPQERVRILVRFNGFPGIFNYHCHLLEHEDLGMMRNYQILP